MNSSLMPRLGLQSSHCIWENRLGNSSLPRLGFCLWHLSTEWGLRDHSSRFLLLVFKQDMPVCAAPSFRCPYAVFSGFPPLPMWAGAITWFNSKREACVQHSSTCGSLRWTKESALEALWF
jgi:hypothetical protein